MNLADLLAALEGHTAATEEEVASLVRILRFLQEPADPFARANPKGHVTASAVIARPDASEFLLVHHRKLAQTPVEIVTARRNHQKVRIHFLNPFPASRAGMFSWVT